MQCLLLSVVKNCESFSKTCIFLIRGPEKRLVHFFEKDFIILECEPIILDYNMLNFEILVDLLTPSLVEVGKFAYL